jgi:hypothetical protein
LYFIGQLTADIKKEDKISMKKKYLLKIAFYRQLIADLKRKDKDKYKK